MNIQAISYRGFLIALSLLPVYLTSQTIPNVVINEVITDPEQDWSAANFMYAPGGSSGSNDEWIEIFINEDGIDLTGWTIELLDGTDVIGDLTSSGAFDVSNYISSGSGIFTNTEAGDYLVLGNVDGSGAINNDVKVVLKDNNGVGVDFVQLGGGAGEAPGGAAAGINDESSDAYPMDRIPIWTTLISMKELQL